MTPTAPSTPIIPMTKINNPFENQRNCMGPAVTETLRYSMDQEPFFQWVLTHPELLNEQLINGLIVNLYPLKEVGKQFLRDLQAFTPKHKEVLGDKKVVAPSQMGIKNGFDYDVLTQLGYTGPSQSGNPASSTYKRLGDLKFINRGLSVNEKGKLLLNGNVFARYVLTRMKLVSQGFKQMYVYEKTGQYRLIDEGFLKKLCRDLLHEAKEDIWCRNWENEYFEAVKRTCPYVTKMDPYSNYINLKNGMLNLDTMVLEDHDPKYLSTIQIAVKHDTSASCPNFLGFLQDIFENDHERVELIQEMLGYCFLQDVKIHKAFIFLGSGSNGKSVLAEVMRNLLGSINVSNVALSNLNGRFGMQNLPGKLVNISSENEFDKKFNSQSFKVISGGDSTNVEQKNKDSFDIKLFVKLIILLNRMMDSDDSSFGYYRRFVVIPFNKVFKELKAGEIPQEGVSYMDKELTGRLLGELDGIFSFAMEGLKRLNQNNFNLTHSKVCERALEEYMRKQNPVIEFYHDVIEIDVQASVKRSDIKKSFAQWAVNNGYEESANMGATKFWELFKKVLVEKQVVIDEKKIHGHIYTTGIRMKTFDVEQSDYVPPTY